MTDPLRLAIVMGTRPEAVKLAPALRTGLLALGWGHVHASAP